LGESWSRIDPRILNGSNPCRLPTVGETIQKKGREGRETAGSDGSWERRRSSAIAAPLDLLLAPLHPISSSSWCRSYLLLVPLLVVARAPELRRPRSGRAAPAKKAKIRSAPYSDGPKVSIHSIPLFFLMCPCLKL
jgi:hypothetical protein